MSELEKYRAATVTSIGVHCQAHGLTSDSAIEGVIEGLEEKYGQAITVMDLGQLRRLNRDLPGFLDEQPLATSIAVKPKKKKGG